MDIELSNFLSKNRISEEIWGKASISWEELKKIAIDHDGNRERLRDAAELFAREIQRFPTVHSVRWRIKDTDHLLEKIIRKRAAGQEKYLSIDSLNYYSVVTDLIGLRALHLFKDECFSINSHLRSVWEPVETPIAYVREGDPNDFAERFSELGLRVENHPAGYRSIHYVFSIRPTQREVFAEIQVRTIFEEGWSEVDHRVRYPNFSDNQLVAYFLKIFNRLSGSADEMGTFVQGLVLNLGQYENELLREKNQKDEALAAMEKAISELEQLKKQDKEAQVKIQSLQKGIERLRKISDVEEVGETVAGNGGLLTSAINRYLQKTLSDSHISFDDDSGLVKFDASKKK